MEEISSVEYCLDVAGDPYLCTCADPNAPDYPCAYNTPGEVGAAAASVAPYAGDPLAQQQAATGTQNTGCDAPCEACTSDLFHYTSCFLSCLSGGAGCGPQGTILPSPSSIVAGLTLPNVAILAGLAIAVLFFAARAHL